MDVEKNSSEADAGAKFKSYAFVLAAFGIGLVALFANGLSGNGPAGPVPAVPQPMLPAVPPLPGTPGRGAIQQVDQTLDSGLDAVQKGADTAGKAMDAASRAMDGWNSNSSSSSQSP
ncbi:MAG: hypothetical protein R3C10_23825 [Pirellulales bacterium]